MSDRIREIVKRDQRFAVEGYVFVFEAIPVAQRLAGADRHVTGKQLLAGILELASARYGRMAKAVLASWGVKSTDDFGAIVYNLVGGGLMSKTEDDSIEEFHAVYDFDEELVEKYRIRHDESSR